MNEYMREMALQIGCDRQSEIDFQSLLPTGPQGMNRGMAENKFFTHLLAYAHEPKSNFFGSADGEISKSKMSIGRPIVVQALGI